MPKIKNKLNMGNCLVNSKKSENIQYKGISWILKMIFLTEEGESMKSWKPALRDILRFARDMIIGQQI